MNFEKKKRLKINFTKANPVSHTPILMETAGFIFYSSGNNLTKIV